MDPRSPTGRSSTEFMYFMVQVMAGLDPDNPEMVEEQAIPLSTFASTCTKYLQHHLGAYLVVREISEAEYLDWLMRRVGYEGQRYGRRGKGELRK